MKINYVLEEEGINLSYFLLILSKYSEIINELKELDVLTNDQRLMIQCFHSQVNSN